MIGSDDSEYYYSIRYIAKPEAKREFEQYEVIESLQLAPGTYMNTIPNDTYEQVLDAGLLKACEIVKELNK